MDQPLSPPLFTPEAGEKEGKMIQPRVEGEDLGEMHYWQQSGICYTTSTYLTLRIHLGPHGY